MWIMIHLNQSTNKNQKTTKQIQFTNFFFSSTLFIDDRRRGTRIRPTEDNRRHTLGHTNDMHAYSQQNQNLQQRAMDLEVNILSNLTSFMTDKTNKRSERASEKYPAMRHFRLMELNISLCFTSRKKRSAIYFASDAS